jgi:mono/diheme cytochrome c family protein
MFDGGMRRLTPTFALRFALGLALTVAASAATGCEAEPPSTEPATSHARSPGEELRAYLADPEVGRVALVESLVAPENGYSRLRLQRYDEGHWGSLPTYDPPTAPVTVDPLTDGAAAPPAPNEAIWSHCLTNLADFDPTDEALLALGERSFFAYPVQEARGLAEALATPDHAGTWSRDGTFGVVWTLSSTGPRGAYTCATCHASPDAASGALVVGRNNADLDAGKLSVGPDGPRWGEGRVDVTGDGLDNPVVITDLRPLRWQHRLHHAATLRSSVVALAVRIETLIITSNGEAVRPPRAIAAGLAMYLWSLGTSTPRHELTLNAQEKRGERVFEATCAGCHAGEGAAGESVDLAVVGTDPSVGSSTERGTGGYRVPSLRHVGDRRRLFAGGAVADVRALLEPTPERRAAGHPFGLDLDELERAALLAYLRRL